MTQDIDVIICVLKRTRVFLIAYGIFFIGLAVFGVWMLLLRIIPDLQNSDGIFRIVFVLFNLGGVFLFLKLGVPCLKRGVQGWNVEQSPLFMLLQEYPQHIVWIFENPTKDKRQDPTVNVWLVDGEKFMLFVKQDEKNSLIQSLSHFAPSARLGYQPEWIKEYKQDPSSFGAIPKGDNR